MPLRHLVIQRFEDPAVERVQEWIGHLTSEDEVADLLYGRFGRTRGSVLLATQLDDPVGLCGWRQDEGVAFLGPVVVRRDKRRWGAATHMVTEAVEDMRAAGIRLIESVHLEGDVAGALLFARCGFRMVGSEGNGAGSEWVRVERVLKKSK